MGSHPLLERWNCRETDKWESPGLTEVCARSLLFPACFQGALLTAVLVCAGRKPQRSHIKLFAFRPLGTLACAALTKICCQPLCTHADSLEMSARLSDEDPWTLSHFLSSIVCSVASHGQVSFILAPDSEDSKFKSMVLESHVDLFPKCSSGEEEETCCGKRLGR